MAVEGHKIPTHTDAYPQVEDSERRMLDNVYQRVAINQYKEVGR
jgi:hypothetical protein